MKIKLEFEGELYEDQEQVKMYVHAPDMYRAIHRARERIRTRLKYPEVTPYSEEAFLEDLSETLYIEGIE